MKVFCIRIGRSRSGRKHRKKTPTRLEQIANAELLDVALKSPKVLAILVDKFGELPACHEDELEPIINSIKAKSRERAVQTILKHGKQELAARIDRIINEVMVIGSRSESQDKKTLLAGINTSGRNSTPANVYQRQTMGRDPDQGLNLRTLLQSLEVLAFLGKLADRQTKNDTQDITERIYVVEQNGQRVELSEKEYLDYVKQQGPQQKEKSTTPRPDVPPLPGITGTDKVTPELPKEDEEGVSGIES